MKNALFSAALIFLPLSTSLFGQDDPIRVRSNLVIINVNVTDKDNKYVPGLTKDRFEIYDDGIKQTIEHFSAEAAPRSFGIVYDMHPTTRERSRLMIQSLRRFAGGLPAGDTFFSVLFNERGSLVADIVPDLDQLERHLAQPSRREPSSLYDAIYLAAEKLRVQGNMKKALIIISDAQDHGSRHNYNAIREQLKRLDVQVYSVIPNSTEEFLWTYNDETRSAPRPTPSSADKAALSQLAHRSGGGSYSTSLANQSQLDTIMGEIGEDTRQQYIVGFYPERTPGDKSHILEVRLTGKKREVGGLLLRYRQTYSGRE